MILYQIDCQPAVDLVGPEDCLPAAAAVGIARQSGRAAEHLVATLLLLPRCDVQGVFIKPRHVMHREVDRSAAPCDEQQRKAQNGENDPSLFRQNETSIRWPEMNVITRESEFGTGGARFARQKSSARSGTHGVPYILHVPHRIKRDHFRLSAFISGHFREQFNPSTRAWTVFFPAREAAG
jgi:hypothetical protein